ncbi:MerR family transcriptional regulator [Aliikangiella sp. G2MR2-5]|uniref:MerR family transcriptional regulator n=1 Tax=Aliikangiella sp. G2MR2-5 TaxID=2788943 RepID=UPI001FEE708F|nr:MerR family transcriptional regulator [Aliikangiella sp. G2MR2-5]
MPEKLLTISKVARKFSVSRTTLLYYEKEGVLLPASRSDNGYRWYGKKEVEQLALVINYRNFGLPISQIKNMLNSTRETNIQKLLKEQFASLESQIQSLRQQQEAIIHYLGESSDKEEMTKEKWTAIMRASGMDDDDMVNWHIQFEKNAPQAHQEFLESLMIEHDEIKKIRGWYQINK